MVIKFKYKELLAILTEVATVIDDSLANEDMKNIIFEIKNGVLNIITTSTTIVYKHSVDKEIYDIDINEDEYTQEDDELVYRFQLKSKELLNFLNTYKSSKRTQVNEVKFTTLNNMHIECKVTEEEIVKNVQTEETDSDEIGFLSEQGVEETKTQRKGFVSTSKWLFNTAAIKLSILMSIKQKVDANAEAKEIKGTDIAYHTKNMLQVVSNKIPTYSYTLFDKDYVLGFNPAYTTVMKNRLNEDGLFENIKLSYKVIQFLDKIISKNETVKVVKTQTHLCIMTENSVSFLIYETKLPNYRPYIDLFTKNFYISLDKMFLKDIIKRLSLLKETIEFDVDVPNRVIRLSNSKFSQPIIIQHSHNMDDRTFRFKIMPEVLTKAISCSNYEDTNNELRLYYCPSESTTILVFTDGEDSWFTTAKIAIY